MLSKPTFEFCHLKKGSVFARFFGHARVLENGLEISTRASISVGGPLPVRFQKMIPYEALESISLDRPWHSPWKITATLKASAPGTFDDFEPQRGRTFKVKILRHSNPIKQIATDLNLRIAEAKSQAYQQQIKQAQNPGTPSN